MITEITLQLSPEENFSSHENLLKRIAAAQHIPSSRIGGIKLLKRSIDARGKNIKYVTKWAVAIDEPIPSSHPRTPPQKQVANAPEIIIVGAGPAGYFAAIGAIEMGLKPIVIERGKEVRARRRDLAELTKNHIVHPDSNYCFGEGGAGTYSDGKLYTRSDKRGDVDQVLQYLVFFGADEDILVNARPHIGTNKLPAVITAMRDYIEACGGEVHFEKCMESLIIQQDCITGIKLRGGETILSNAVVLATGHSARSVFEMLYTQGVFLEAKALAIGVRAEHPQTLIDSVQYHTRNRGELLPPAYYSLSAQVESRGVYSFCMCPGGIIAPCATEPGEIVTNGWSPSKRNNPYANSGIVVELRLEDIYAYSGKSGPLAAMEFQAKIERDASAIAGGTQVAPAQRMVDFTQGKTSTSVPVNSYLPGTSSVNLHEVFPHFIATKLSEGFKAFGKKIPPYFSNEAVLVAPETRTSSPVRIPRDKETLMHPQVQGLFPCGEGPGYAGGIISAAIDGLKVAYQAATRFSS